MALLCCSASRLLSYTLRMSTDRNFQFTPVHVHKHSFFYHKSQHVTWRTFHMTTTSRVEFSRKRNAFFQLSRIKSAICVSEGTWRSLRRNVIKWSNLIFHTSRFDDEKNVLQNLYYKLLKMKNLISDLKNQENLKKILISFP